MLSTAAIVAACTLARQTEFAAADANSALGKTSAEVIGVLSRAHAGGMLVQRDGAASASVAGG